MNTPSPFFILCNAVNPATGSVQTGMGYDTTVQGVGGMWHIGYPPQTRYNHVMPPNTVSCNSGGGGGAGSAGAHTASSRHSGIVNVLLCDGSVRTVKNTIAVNVWWSIGTKANNEAVSADSF